MTCQIVGCNGEVVARGWCGAHYQRWRTGHPLGGPIPRTRAERFWSKVNKNGPVPEHCPELGPCWLWTGGTDGAKDGYGRYVFDRETRKQDRAHRVAWFLTYGKWPEPNGCHHCDRPLCVRPSHVYEGDPATNSADKIRRGRDRHPAGEANPAAKLTAVQVQEIRTRWATGGIRQKTLAAEYGISLSLLGQIIRRAVWKSVA